jgi:hypothetical protein
VLSCNASSHLAPTCLSKWHILTSSWSKNGIPWGQLKDSKGSFSSRILRKPTRSLAIQGLGFFASAARKGLVISASADLSIRLGSR